MVTLLKKAQKTCDIFLWMKGKEKWVPYPKDYIDIPVGIPYLSSWLATVLDVFSSI